MSRSNEQIAIIKPLSHHPGNVRSYFGLIGKPDNRDILVRNKVVCLLCSCVYGYWPDNVSNLECHFARNHSNIDLDHANVEVTLDQLGMQIISLPSSHQVGNCFGVLANFQGQLLAPSTALCTSCGSSFIYHRRFSESMASHYRKRHAQLQLLTATFTVPKVLRTGLAITRRKQVQQQQQPQQRKRLPSVLKRRPEISDYRRMPKGGGVGGSGRLRSRGQPSPSRLEPCVDNIVELELKRGTDKSVADLAAKPNSPESYTSYGFDPDDLLDGYV